MEGIAKRIGERIHAQGFSQNEEAAGAAGTRQDEKRKTKRTYAERPRYRITGFKALYIRYCYMLGCYPGKHMTSKQVNYLYREDLTKLRKIRSETKFLCSNKIETLQDLTDVEYELKQDLKRYQSEKNYVTNRLRAAGDNKQALMEKRDYLSEKIKDCRKKLYWCKDIKENSQKMKDKVQKVRELERGREHEQKEREL